MTKIREACDQLWQSVVDAYDVKDLQAIDCIHQEVEQVENLIEARLRILMLGSKEPEVIEKELPFWAKYFFDKTDGDIVQDAKKLLLILQSKINIPEAEIDLDFFLPEKNAIEISWGGHVTWVVKRSKFRWPGINVRLYFHHSLVSPKFVGKTFFVANHLIDETIKCFEKLNPST